MTALRHLTLENSSSSDNIAELGAQIASLLSSGHLPKLQEIELDLIK